MSVAAYAVPVDRRGEWLEELERILDHWDDLSVGAQDAVTASVESFLGDRETPEMDCVRARVLLARVKPGNSRSGALACRLGVGPLALDV